VRRILDNIVICALLLAFMLSVMDYNSNLVHQFDSIKWYTLGGSLVYGLFYQRKHAVLTSRGISGPHLYWLLFIVVAGISTVVNSVVTAPIEAFLRLSSFVGLYLLAFWLAFPHNPLQRISQWTAILSLLSYSVVLLSTPWLSPWAQMAGNRLRGVTSTANTLGTFAAIAGLAALGNIVATNTSWAKAIMYGALLSASSVCMYNAGSRSALLGFFGGCLVVASIRVSRRLLCCILLLSVCGIGILAFHSSADMHSLLQSVETLLFWRPIEIDSSRSVIWQTHMHLFSTAPLVGHGLVIDLYNGGRTSGESSYTDILASTGCIGGGAFAFAIGFGMIALAKVLKRTRRVVTQLDISIQVTNAAAIVACILVNSVGEGYMAAVGSAPTIFCWVILGAAIEDRWSVWKPVVKQRSASPIQLPEVCGKSRSYFRPARPSCIPK